MTNDECRMTREDRIDCAAETADYNINERATSPETFGARFRLGDDAQFRPGLSLGESGRWFRWDNWRSGGLRRAVRRPIVRERQRRIDSQLFRARSSADGNLRVVSGRPGNECGDGILPRAEDHPSAEMGMSRDIHLFGDETGRAYSPNLAKTARTIRRSAGD